MANVIEIIFKATDDITAPTNKVDKSLGGLKKTLAQLGAGFAAFTVARKFIQNTEAQQAAVAQLEATLNSTGGAAGRTSEQLQAQAAALQRVTTYGDEAIISMQSVLGTFTEIKGTNFDAATVSILDLATKMGTDLRSAALQVGKALNDPKLGITALSRAGIQFSEDQQAMIKALVDTGKTAEAQRIILKELERQFGGSAKAARDTLGGALKALENAYNDLFEGSKETTKQVVDGLNEITEVLSDPGTQEAAQTFFSGILRFATSTAKSVFEIAGGVKVLSENLAARVNGPAADDIIRITDQIEYLENLRGIDFKDILTNSEYLDRIRLFSDDGLVTFWNNEELDAKIKELYGKLEAAQKASGQSVLQVEAETQESPLTNVVPVSAGEALKRFKEQFSGVAAAIDASRTAEEKQIITLSQQIELLNTLQNAYSELSKEQLSALGISAEEFANVETAVFNLQKQLDLLKVPPLLEDFPPIEIEISPLETERLNKEIENITSDFEERFLKFDEFAQMAAEGMQDAFVDFFMNMDKGFDGVLKGFIDLVRRMIAEALAAMAVKALLGAFGFSTAASGGKIFGINKMPAQSRPVPGRASGGMVPVRVGEEGPEMAFLPVGTQIMNARQMAFNATGGGMGGGGFNYQPVYDIRIESSGDPADIENRLSLMLERRLAQHTNEIMTKMRNNGFGRLR